MSDPNQKIVPMLCYDDAAAAIDFLQRAFGFELVFRYDMPDGHVGHAELALDGARISLATTWHGGGMRSPRDLEGAHSQLYVIVDDVDAHHARARDAGAIIVRAPVDSDHGDRTYRALDPEGQRWYFASPLA